MLHRHATPAADARNGPIGNLPPCKGRSGPKIRWRDGSHLISTDVVGHQVIRHCRLPQMRHRYGRSPVRINLSRSCHRRGVDSTYGEPQRIQRIASRLSQRLTSILFAPQVWFRPRAAARYAAAVVTSASNVRPLDGVAAALKTRRADTVVLHHSCKRLARTKSNPHAEFPTRKSQTFKSVTVVDD